MYAHACVLPPLTDPLGDRVSAKVIADTRSPCATWLWPTVSPSPVRVPASSRRTWSLRLAAATFLVVLLGIGAQLSPAAASDDRRLPVLVRGQDPSARIGTMLVQEQWIQSARHKLISVRGSVRLPAGRWCIRTWVSIKAPRSGQSRIVRVALDGPEVVRLPRITRQIYREPRINTLIAQSAVHRNGCAGALYASGQYHFYGDGH